MPKNKDRRIRRDPRRERIARQGKSVGGSEHFDIDGRADRVRKFPHFCRSVTYGERVRINPFAATQNIRCSKSESQPKKHESKSDIKPSIITDPSYFVVVVPDLLAGRPTDHDRLTFSAARQLASDTDGAVLAVLFEDSDFDFGKLGVDRIMKFSTVLLAGYSPEYRADAIVSIAQETPVRHILFPDSKFGSGDLGRRVAARLGCRPASGVRQIGEGQIVCKSADPLLEIHRSLCTIMLMDPEIDVETTQIYCEGRELNAPLVDISMPKLQDGGLEQVDVSGIPLSEASLILAAGAGVSDWQEFYNLAESLGAAIAGSRVVVDKGFVGRDRQVGASGVSVAGRCYIALGISGAPQHLQGIVDCDLVIAVNTDPGCPMSLRADLMIVGDVNSIMPILREIISDRL